MEELLESSSMEKPVKARRNGIYGLIRKWMPSKKNPMKKLDMIDDIRDKLANHREGQYYYCYEKGWNGNGYPEMLKKRRL